MPTMTLEQLNAHLWKAADILRGQIDASDYKNYIFGFLFLKRLSDVFEEEGERIEQETGDPELAWNDPDEHQFFVPERARWSEIRKLTQNLGDALNKACAALEEANPGKLEGVLLGIDFNDERKLGDSRNRDAILMRLIQHFSDVSLRNADLPEPDMLGRAYEYLIERFADDAGKKGGEFYTPRRVVQLIVELLTPTEGMRICDPTVGSGGMLIECAKYVERHGGDPRNLSLFGQEKNLGTWAICKMNMLLHGLPDARIEKGDTLRDPRLLRDGELMLFDRVIANPPFSLKEWGYKEAQHDGYGRFRYGLPPQTKGDLAFVQHMVATCNDQGMVGVVMPHGVLFRGGREEQIRRGMLEDDLFEAVIGLPANLFYGTGIPATVLVLRSRGDAKPRQRRGRIIFIHAADYYEEGKNQNYLREEDIDRIVTAFREYRDIERFARVVDLDEIRRNDYNLNISRYVDTSLPEEPIDVAEALARLRELELRRNEAVQRMDKLLAELGYDR